MSLSKEINFFDNLTNNSKLFINRSNQSFQDAQKTINIGNYYSAGSFCYNANINAQTALLHAQNLSYEEFEKKYKK